MLLPNTSTLTTLLAVAIAFAYVVLFLIILRRWQPAQQEKRPWLLLAVFTALLSLLPHFVNLPLPPPLDAESLGVILSAAALLAFSRLSVRYLQHYVNRLTTLGAIVWLVAVGLAGAALEPVILGEPGWIGNALQTGNLAALLAMVGWLLLFSYHIWLTRHAYKQAHLPELANRRLFWAVVVPLAFLGVALGNSGVQPWAIVGWFVQWLSLMGAAYALASHSLFDIRRAWQRTLRFWLLSMVTASVFFAATFTVLMGLWTPSFLTVVLLTLVAALLAAPMTRLADMLLSQVLGHALTDPTQVLRRYSQEISGQINLTHLASRLTGTLNAVLNVRRSALILAREQGDVSVLEPIGPNLPDEPASLAHDGAIYQTLCGEGGVLLQYDLEYQQRFADVEQEERDFFVRLEMNVYVPILVEDELVGVIACGPKVIEAPFYKQELELLAAIANQTGIALRNARLVTDLRNREAEMVALNERLGRLDSVKSDFITIASHELRTPLAQIRGYTDIMQAFSEQGMLDEHVMSDMTAKLRKATGRLEVLISDMLDVSQLDVNAMDLRFVEAKPVSLIRMAIEPLTDAIKERNLTLVARGLRDLPVIKADLERLVQALRNVIVNAIKYTPDGGSIEITGSLYQEPDGSAPDEDEEPQAIHISIADTGVGIMPEHLELIFEKFFRGVDPSLHSTGATKFMGAGPGLGLTIARGVIEGHGGRIWSESEGMDPEAFPGATFHIILPITPPEDASRVLQFELGNPAQSATANEEA